LQSDEEFWRTDRPPETDASSLRGGADSSNRPWETDSVAVGASDPPPALGALAICAAALLAVADVALLYSPDGGALSAGHQGLADVASWRLLLGHYLGILLLPAYIPGYWLVKHGLRGAGAWSSWAVFLLGSYAAAIAIARHALVAPLALIARLGGSEPPGSSPLLALARGYAEPVQGLVAGLLLLASIWFAVAVLSGRSRFPRWLAAANPMALALLLVATHLLTSGFRPSPFAAQAAFDLAHLVFFCLIAVALRRAPAPS
jgi:hypothetical protein